jgi:hypothetical protein
MERLKGHGEWAIDLCKAFGENPDKVRKIDLTVEVGKPVIVSFQKFVKDDNGISIIQMIKKIAWVEEPEGLQYTEGENNG